MEILEENYSDASSSSLPIASASAEGPGTSTVHEMLYLMSLYLSKHTPCAQLSDMLVSELVFIVLLLFFKHFLSEINYIAKLLAGKGISSREIVHLGWTQPPRHHERSKTEIFKY